VNGVIFLVKSINQIATARVVGSCLLSFPCCEIIGYILPHTAHERINIKWLHLSVV